MQKNRYLISHPSINKESYISSHKIQALYFSLDQDPSVLSNTYDEIISYVGISPDYLSIIPLNPYSHFVVSYNNFVDEMMINYYATKLFRIHTNRYSESIYGPAILFGSVDFLTSNNEYQHYSVPYEIMEQVSRLLV